MNLVKQIPCLAPSLCDQVIKEAKHSVFGRAMVNGVNGSPLVDQGRSNFLCGIPESFTGIILSALNNALSNWSKQVAEECPGFWQQLKLPGVTPGLNTRIEATTILRYEKGQEYKCHVDQPLLQKTTVAPYTSDTRNWSIVLYLNDDFDGGETQVLDDIYIPKKGTALVFPSSWHYPHTALPVENGTKYSIVTWYHPEIH